ncbi:MAG: hypothetical protein ACTHMA_04280 [Thermomicrobiales bacterium]|jgi:hypothetical protein
MNQPFVITTTMWQYYLATWQAMFREFFGWSDAETLRWAEQWQTVADVADPDDIFYHESPQYWARNLFISDDLRARLAHEDLLDLQQRLRLAFWDEQRYHFPLDTDWRPYREQVARILAEYGAALPATPAR